VTGKISITCDAWTSPTQVPFLGITAHWIGDKFEMCSQVLDLVRLNGPHSGENLAKAIAETLRDYSIMDKVGDI